MEKKPSVKERLEFIERILHDMHFDLPIEQHKVGSEWFELDQAFVKFKNWARENLQDYED